jgi:hypothetical protein
MVERWEGATEEAREAGEKVEVVVVSEEYIRRCLFDSSQEQY